MTEMLATNESIESLDPNALLRGEITFAVLDTFRSKVFRSINSVEHLRDWLGSPMAQGMARSLVLWALGRHREALDGLLTQKNNPAIADCIARSYIALGKVAEADAMLTNKTTDPRHAFTWLLAVESTLDAERLQNLRLDKVTDSSLTFACPNVHSAATTAKARSPATTRSWASRPTTSMRCSAWR